MLPRGGRRQSRRCRWHRGPGRRGARPPAFSGGRSLSAAPPRDRQIHRDWHAVGPGAGSESAADSDQRPSRGARRGRRPALVKWHQGMQCLSVTVTVHTAAVRSRLMVALAPSESDSARTVTAEIQVHLKFSLLLEVEHRNRDIGSRPGPLAASVLVGPGPECRRRQCLRRTLGDRDRGPPGRRAPSGLLVGRHLLGMSPLPRVRAWH